MSTEGPASLLAWAVMGILVASSALAVLASRASGMLAILVALGGTTAAMLLAWAAQSAAAEKGEKPAERPLDEHREAA